MAEMSSECPKKADLPPGGICECHLCLFHSQAEAKAAQTSTHGSAKDPSRRGDVGSLLSHQNCAAVLEQSINLSQHHSE